ncbi:hypothetical protein SODALDRAFT_180889 [Sodiomyces alkalinus F11]|uniref:Uncharacterized protein n=1 Tax=Sodiomyces alkalinus (strain CBS 110278 / VKM F-3762 / F11) TaxID=1314773 RepID=A0A3N2PU79_SODAK|nr:hypothetical protein SODALDRAFT_180889 [Sodiomyces alkalinus F11]ROT38073.1 hypothetical protein SODALDRAFT_180889 [Sodiomyces alkalinus F11]
MSTLPQLMTVDRRHAPSSHASSFPGPHLSSSQPLESSFAPLFVASDANHFFIFIFFGPLSLICVVLTS